MGEIPHLHGSEAFVKLIEAKTAQSEPFLRALKVALDLRCGETRIENDLASLPLARQHDQRPGKVRFDSIEPSFLDLCRKRLRIMAHRGVFIQLLLATIYDRFEETRRKRVFVIHLCGVRRIEPIAIHKFLHDCRGVCGVGRFIIQTPLYDEASTRATRRLDERLTHIVHRMTFAHDPKIASERKRGVIGLLCGKRHVVHIAHDNRLPRAFVERFHVERLAYAHVGRIRFAIRPGNIHCCVLEHAAHRAALRPDHAGRSHYLAQHAHSFELLGYVGFVFLHGVCAVGEIIKQSIGINRGRKLFKKLERTGQGAQALKTFLLLYKPISTNGNVEGIGARRRNARKRVKKVIRARSGVKRLGLDYRTDREKSPAEVGLPPKTTSMHLA